MDIPNMDAEMSKYNDFINDVLREDLRKLELQLQTITKELEDLIQLKHTLQVVGGKEVGFKSQVDLGCGFLMEAQVKDSTKLLMNIGLNHYLEFTIPEAHMYLDARINYFERQGAVVQKKAAETKASIKFMLAGISQLEKQNKKT